MKAYERLLKYVVVRTPCDEESGKSPSSECQFKLAGSLISFPVFGSKCAPVQHMVNIFCAVLLGPGYGVMSAFVASLIRNLLVFSYICLSILHIELSILQDCPES